MVQTDIEDGLVLSDHRSIIRLPLDIKIECGIFQHQHIDCYYCKTKDSIIIDIIPQDYCLLTRPETRIPRICPYCYAFHEFTIRTVEFIFDLPEPNREGNNNNMYPNKNKKGGKTKKK